MRYFFHIAYDGSFYSGWQWQPNSFSVQEMLEEKLEKIFKRKVTVFGCGRTDKGVHASQYFFHIELDKEPDFELEFVIKQHLPSTISLFEVIKVKDDQNSRFDASSRSYDYFLHTVPDPFLDRYSTLFNYESLDFELMQKAASVIQNYEDFRVFCLQPETHNHTRCKISNAELIVNPSKTRMRFSITGDRFLKGMIRALMSALIKVGRKQITVEEFEDFLINPRDISNLKIAPPNGLYLSSVEYPYLKRDNQSIFFKSLLRDSAE